MLGRFENNIGKPIQSEWKVSNRIKDGNQTIKGNNKKERRQAGRQNESTARRKKKKLALNERLGKKEVGRMRKPKGRPSEVQDEPHRKLVFSILPKEKRKMVEETKSHVHRSSTSWAAAFPSGGMKSGKLSFPGPRRHEK
ncbi:hypothetical protein RUM44_010516 [Polyplax serrata]|uniref:Uncharacterized protein n=1 Tax=Polyplax serrata TaxID=468196 RepID=A0ABR1AVQ2_POLSC